MNPPPSLRGAKTTKQQSIRPWIASLTLAMALIIPFFPHAAQAQDITSGLTAHWTLDETSGSSIADSAGSNTGTWTDGTGNNVAEEATTSAFGNALNFDGSNDKITIADSATFSFTGDFTISAWVKHSGAAESSGSGDGWRIISQQSNSGGLHFLLRIIDTSGGTNGLAQFSFNTGSGIHTISSTTNVKDGNWHLITGMRQGSDILIYVDDTLENTVSGVETGTYNISAPAYISSYKGGSQEYFSGYIDDIKIYSRALSAADITALYEASFNCTPPAGKTGEMIFNDDTKSMQYCNGTNWVGIGPDSSVTNGLVGHWKLDETSGAAIADETGTYNGTWSDGSGNDVAEETSAGQIGTAFDFDSADDMVQLPNLLANEDPEPFTVCAWFNASSLHNGTIWNYAAQAFNNFDRIITLGVKSSGVVFAGKEDQDAESSTTYTADSWNHICGIFAANGDRKVYLNAGGLGTDTTNRGANNLNRMAIGARWGDSSSRFFDGKIDDVRIYDRVLSAAEISKIYGQSTLSCTGTGPLTLEATIDTSGKANRIWLQDGYIFLSDQSTVNAYTFDGSTFTPVGTPYDNSGLSVGIWGDGEYIYFTTGYGHALYAATFDGSTFTIIDTIALTDRPYSLIGDGEYIYVAESANGVVAYRFDGTSLTPVGSWAGLNGRNVFVNNGYVYLTSADGIFSILRFNGSTFTEIATYDSPSAVGSPVLDFDGQTIFVAFISNGTAVTALNFDGTTITEIDNSSASGFGSSIWHNGTNVYATRSSGGIAIFSFDGTDLTYLETSTDGSTNYTYVTGDGRYIYQADDTAGLHAYSGYSDCYCAQPSLPKASLIFNDTHDVMQYCNGVDWIAMGPPGNGGAGCSSPSGLPAELIYNSDLNILQYCEGDEWIAMTPKIEDQLASGLVGYWKLDETSGAAITDSSGNSNNGVWSDGVDNDVTGETISAPVGKGLSVDGSNDLITVPHDATLDISTGYTISSWVYFDSSQSTSPITPSLIGKNNGGGWGSGWLVGRTSGGGNVVGGKIRLSVQHDRNMNSPNADYSGWHYPVDTWDYVTVSWDGTNVKYYLNGALVDTGTVTIPPSTSSGDLTIGYARSNWYNTYHDGYIDDMRLYNRALSEAEITALYALGTDPCSRSPAIGTTCFDGSVYVGLTQDGNVPIYTTSATYETTDSYNDGNTNYSRLDTCYGGAGSQWKGECMTAAMIAMDSDDIAAGFQPHNAAVYCDSLSAHGHSDWYLPSLNELLLFWNGGAPVGGVLTDGTNYHSSNERNRVEIWQVHFDDGGINGGNTKEHAAPIRCVRKL